MGREFPFGVMNMSWDRGVIVGDTVGALNTSDLYTYKWLMVNFM